MEDSEREAALVQRYPTPVVIGLVVTRIETAIDEAIDQIFC